MCAQVNNNCSASAELQQSLGIDLVSVKRDRVVAEMSLGDEHLSPDGWVNEDVVVTLARVANSQGVTQGDSAQGVRALDSRFSLFEAGQGDTLIAESRLIHADGDLCTWTAAIYRCATRQRRSPKHCVAECTQRIKLQPTKVGAEPVLAEAGSKERAKVVTLSAEDDSGAISTVSQQRRRQIFEGACDVITRDGYAATTIRKISAAANIPISTMYQYINTKEDILFMITSGCMEEIFNFFQEELREAGTAEQKLYDAVDAYIKYISRNRKYINLAYSETRALSKENREKIFEIERQFAGLWEAIIAYGNETKEFSIENTDLTANMIYFFCNVWALRYWSIERYTEEEVRDYLLRFILSGLKSAPKPKLKR